MTVMPAEKMVTIGQVTVEPSERVAEIHWESFTSFDLCWYKVHVGEYNLNFTFINESTLTYLYIYIYTVT